MARAVAAAATSCLLAVILLSAFGGALAQGRVKTYNGELVRDPNNPKDFVRTFVEVNARGLLRSVGVEYTVGFLANAKNLPSQNVQNISLAPGVDFPYLGYTQDLKIPFNKDGSAIAQNPFKWVRIENSKNGFSIIAPDPITQYGIPNWQIHFHYDAQADWDKLWFPDGTPLPALGPCLGLSPNTFAAATRPIAKQCYPNLQKDRSGRSPQPLNIAFVVFRHGQHYMDTTMPEWAPAEFNSTWAIGSYDGVPRFVEPFFSDRWLLSRDKKGTCMDFPIPQQLPTARLWPKKYCVRRSSDNKSILIELLDFVLIPKGDCTVTPQNVDKRSFLPNVVRQLLGPECNSKITWPDTIGKI